MLTLHKDLTKDSIEKSYSKTTSITHRKQYAQYFTPYPIAEFMCKWLMGNHALQSVLEPAFGLGIFSRILLTLKSTVDIKGFEIDEKIYREGQKFFKENLNVNIVLEDYMYGDWGNKYDGIICNPPYFKFHDYDNKDAVKEIENKLGYKLNGFTNLYTLFLLKSIFQLNPGGRAAYLIPSEFMNSDYGKQVKSFLVKSRTLRHIIIVDFQENIFDDALTTACILLCANDHHDHAVRFSNIASVEQLTETERIIHHYPIGDHSSDLYRTDALNPDIKWRSYYQQQHSEKFRYLVPFSNFGKVVRGIATGSNEYFTFTKSKTQEFKIPDRYLLPCICKAADVRSAFFTLTDVEELKEKERPIYLLNATHRQDEHVNKYLHLGEQIGIHSRHLTANRNPWYALENRPPAPIWVSVFNRKGLKFIRNEANVSNLTTFHCIYPSPASLFQGVHIDLLFAYLLTDTAHKIFEDNRREYGNGLQKYEPNDLNKAKVLDLTLLDEDTVHQILQHYHAYRQSVLQGDQNPEYIIAIDKLLIAKYSQPFNH